MAHPKISISRTAVALRDNREATGGVVGFMSWNRLVETLRAAGEVNAHEIISAIVLTDDGLKIYYESVGG